MYVQIHSMLNPDYEKIKVATKNMLDEQNAETVSICLEAFIFSSWVLGHDSTVHFRQLGVNQVLPVMFS